MRVVVGAGAGGGEGSGRGGGEGVGRFRLLKVKKHNEILQRAQKNNKFDVFTEKKRNFFLLQVTTFTVVVTQNSL